MKTSAKKVSDMTVDELKSVIHEVITEDMEAWRETFEIMADKHERRRGQVATFNKFVFLILISGFIHKKVGRFNFRFQMPSGR